MKSRKKKHRSKQGISFPTMMRVAKYIAFTQLLQVAKRIFTLQRKRKTKQSILKDYIKKKDFK